MYQVNEKSLTWFLPLTSAQVLEALVAHATGGAPLSLPLTQENLNFVLTRFDGSVPYWGRDFRAPDVRLHLHFSLTSVMIAGYEELYGPGSARVAMEKHLKVQDWTNELKRRISG